MLILLTLRWHCAIVFFCSILQCNDTADRVLISVKINNLLQVRSQLRHWHYLKCIVEFYQSCRETRGSDRQITTLSQTNLCPFSINHAGLTSMLPSYSRSHRYEWFFYQLLSMFLEENSKIWESQWPTNKHWNRTPIRMIHYSGNALNSCPVFRSKSVTVRISGWTC